MVIYGRDGLIFTAVVVFRHIIMVIIFILNNDASFITHHRNVAPPWSYHEGSLRISAQSVDQESLYGPSANQQNHRDGHQKERKHHEEDKFAHRRSQPRDVQTSEIGDAKVD